LGEFGPFDALADRAHDLYLQGACEEAVLNTRESLQIVDATNDVPTRRYLHYVAGIALIELGRFAEAIAEGQVLLAEVDPVTEPYWRAKGLALIAEASGAMGEVTRTLDALAEGSFLLAAAPSRAYNHMSASMAVAIALRQLYLFEQADELLMASVHREELLLDLHVLQEAALLRLHWGAVLDLVGEPEAARRHYLVALQRALWMQRNAEELDHEVMLGMSLMYQAYVWERLGETELARRLTLSGLATHPQREAKIEMHLANLTLGRVHAAAGDFREAREQLAGAAERAQQARREVWSATGLAALADVDESEIGPHPGIAKWRWLARELLARIWRDRVGRFSALSARIRVRELLEQTDRMGQAVLTDPLTGLGNRRLLVETLERAEGDVSVVFVDIDRFKDVNDTFSHEVGDQVIRRVADILRSHCRAEDVLVRYGGDEFVVLVNGETTAAGVIAERVLTAVRETRWDEIAEGLKVSVSIGLATSLPSTDAMAHADIALYSAKRGGRDQVVSS
jgi:diguanylate cyclase (GGDEF)-like protein